MESIIEALVDRDSRSTVRRKEFCQEQGFLLGSSCDRLEIERRLLLFEVWSVCKPDSWASEKQDVGLNVLANSSIETKDCSKKGRLSAATACRAKLKFLENQIDFRKPGVSLFEVLSQESCVPSRHCRVF